MRAMAADSRSISARREGRCGMPSSSKRSIGRTSWATRATGSARKRRAPVATSQPAASRNRARPIASMRMVRSISARNSASGTMIASCQPLNHKGESADGVAGAADLEPDLLLDVPAGLGPGRDPLAGGERHVRQLRRQGAACRLVGAMTMPPCGPTTNEPPVRPTAIEPSSRAKRP